MRKKKYQMVVWLSIQKTIHRKVQLLDNCNYVVFTSSSLEYRLATRGLAVYPHHSDPLMPATPPLLFENFQCFKQKIERWINYNHEPYVGLLC